MLEINFNNNDQKDNFDALNQIQFFYKEGNFVEAFSKGIMLQESMPDSPELHNIVGASELALGDPKAAANSYARAIEVAPTFLDSYNNLGSLYSSLGMKDEALAIYKVALRINNEEPRLYFNIGNLLLDNEMFELAEESFLEALRLDPDYTDAYYNVACALIGTAKKNKDQKDKNCFFEKSLSYLERVRIENSGNPDYFNLLGEVQFSLGKFVASEKNFKKTISLNKKCAEAYVNLARLRSKDRDFFKAINLAKNAIEINPALNLAKIELAQASFNLSQVEQAIKFYKEATRTEKEIDHNIFNLSLALAAAGNFDEAWDLYECRFELGLDKELFDLFSIFPKWDGKSNCRLALWQEQGVGDVVIFSTILADVQKICSNITLFIDERLIEVFKASFPGIKFKSKNASLEIGSFDAQLPLGSLPKIFRKKFSEFKKPLKPLLEASEYHIKYVEKLLGNKVRPRCGISWFTSAAQIADDRSIDLKSLIKVFEGLDVDLINLQYPTKDKDSIVSKSLAKKVITLPEIDLKDDFTSSIALMDSCDFIVTIDNVTAHLASALGKNSFVLLPLAPPNFRWMLKDKSSPWYEDSTVLIRKKKTGVWSQALEELKVEVKKFMKLK